MFLQQWLLQFMNGSLETGASEHLQKWGWIEGPNGFKSGALWQEYGAGQRQPVSRCLFVLEKF